MDDDEFMDATMQINAFGLSAGCTFSLDNVPNQLAVLGHFRAMLEMCQNQIEDDPDQMESWKEVESQLRTVKLMIKCAQAKRKAVKVEVMPCILSTSLQHNFQDSSEISASGSFTPVSPRSSMRTVHGRGRRLPKLEGDHSGNSGELATIRNEDQLLESGKEANAKPQADTMMSASSKDKVPQLGDKMPSFNSSGSRKSGDKPKQVPTPPTSGSSFSRYLPSFLRKVRLGSRDKEVEAEVASLQDELDEDGVRKMKSIVDELDLDVKGVIDSRQERRDLWKVETAFQQRQTSC